MVAQHVAHAVERLARKPFSTNELIGPLAKEEPAYKADDDNMRGWYQSTVPFCNKGDAAAAAPAADKKGGGKKKK